MSAHATCFYCGNTHMAAHKLIHSKEVASILEKQQAADIDDIIYRFTCNLLQMVCAKFDNQHQDTWICCCMNCHHWMARRSELPVPPLPMQNLLCAPDPVRVIACLFKQM